jgi:hypothetical protein
MTLDRLRNTTLLRVKLHRTLDLESGGVSRVRRDTDENEPLLVGSGAVVDDLVSGKRGVAVEDLDGSFLRGSVGSGGRGVTRPVVDGRLRDDTEGRRRDPFQKVTSSCMRWARTFCLRSMLKIWSWR